VAKDIEIEQPKQPPPQPTGGVTTDPRQQPAVINATNAHTAYANFCRVTGTPEELVIDFGLNTQPMGSGGDPIAISERIVLNFYTAKRLLAALSMSLQRHEAAFGVLETDVQKRVMPGVFRPPAPTGSG
jgi:Protein of unknown function (DUF3467)